MLLHISLLIKKGYEEFEWKAVRQHLFWCWCFATSRQVAVFRNAQISETLLFLSLKMISCELFIKFILLWLCVTESSCSHVLNVLELPNDLNICKTDDLMILNLTNDLVIKCFYCLTSNVKLISKFQSWHQDFIDCNQRILKHFKSFRA